MEGSKKIYVAGNYIERQDFNISVSGDFHYYGGADFDKREVRAQAKSEVPTVPIGERIGVALKGCMNYIWGNAAYGVVFCVCRDIYKIENNVSSFERMLSDCGISIPEGTINSAMYRNVWMKYHVDKWEEMGVMERVLKLRDAFRKHMDDMLCSNMKTED